MNPTHTIVAMCQIHVTKIPSHNVIITSDTTLFAVVKMALFIKSSKKSNQEYTAGNFHNSKTILWRYLQNSTINGLQNFVREQASVSLMFESHFTMTRQKKKEMNAFLKQKLYLHVLNLSMHVRQAITALRLKLIN